MTQIDEKRIEMARDRFMGKKIECITESGVRYVGVCQFLGYNQFLPTWGLQVTVDRMPVQHVKFESIKFFETKKIF